INQLRYRPGDPKSAVAMSHEALPQSFKVINALTKQAVLDGATKSIAGRWGQFDHHAELEFSGLSKPGRYFVQVGDAQSPPFEIRATVYAELPDQLLEFMREQRC